MDYMIECSRVAVNSPKKEDYYAHIHNDVHEILLFLSGNAYYYVEGNRYNLTPGDLLLMRKGEVHNLVFHVTSRYDRILLNFDLPILSDIDPENRLMRPFTDRKLGHFNHYRANLFPNNNWQHYLEKIVQAKDKYQQLYYLLPLLNELCEAFPIVQGDVIEENENIAIPILKYINKHLTEPLSIEMLAERFYMSKNHLSLIFKQYAGVTVWGYITAKRLLLGRELIQSGTPPTQACTQCGFQDYTTFYRAYVKRYGVMPKEDYKKK